MTYAEFCNALTMRDVNLYKRVKKDIALVRNALTMRDVNSEPCCK